MKNKKLTAVTTALLLTLSLTATACFGQGTGGSTASGNLGGASTAAAANAAPNPATDFQYDLTEDGQGISIRKYTGTATTFVIPAEIEGYPVTEISGDAFRGDEIKVRVASIVLPDTITTIADYAFNGSTLSSINIPAGVTTIGDYAFQKSRLTSITLPAGLTIIGKGAFQETELTAITIPDSVTTIGSAAFRETPLTSIYIPDSVTTMGDSRDYVAFGDCDQLTEVRLSDNLTRVAGLFSDALALKKVNLPKNVKEIGDTSFGGCAELTELIIPDTIQSITFSDEFIGDAFEGCGKLSIRTRQRLQQLGYIGKF